MLRSTEHVADPPPPPPRRLELLRVRRPTVTRPTYRPDRFPVDLVPPPLEVLGLRVGFCRTPVLPHVAGTVVAHTDFSFVRPRLMRFSTLS